MNVSSTGNKTSAWVCLNQLVFWWFFVDVWSQFCSCSHSCHHIKCFWLHFWLLTHLMATFNYNFKPDMFCLKVCLCNLVILNSQAFFFWCHKCPNSTVCVCLLLFVCVFVLMMETAGVFWTGLRQIGGAACCYLAGVQLYLRLAF